LITTPVEYTFKVVIKIVLDIKTLSNREEEYKTSQQKRINKQSYTFKLNKVKRFKTIELAKLYLIEKIKQEVGEFDHVNGDKEKYMEMVMDFMYEEVVEELTTKK
jgi:hypothetical protein